MKTLITKSIDPSKPPALLVRSDNEPQVLRLLAYFVNREACEVFHEVLESSSSGPDWGPGEEPAPDPLPPSVEGGDNVVDQSL